MKYISIVKFLRYILEADCTLVVAVELAVVVGGVAVSFYQQKLP